MPPPPFLVMRYRNGVNPQVGRIVGGTTFTQVGSDVPGTIEVHPDNTSHAVNRVVEFQNTLYCVVSSVLFSYDGIGTWSSLRDFTATVSANVNAHAGLYQVDINGVPHLAGLTQTAASVPIGWTYDGTTFNEITFAGVAGLAPGDAKGRDFLWRNLIWWPVNTQEGGVQHLVFDPVQETLTTYETVVNNEHGNLIDNHGDFVTYNNRLLWVGYSTDITGDPLAIYEFTGSGFQIRGTSDSINIPTSATDALATHAVFVDPTDRVICIGYGRQSGGASGNDNGINMAVFTPSGVNFTGSTGNAFSTAVIPAGLRPVNNGGSYSSTEGYFWHITDNVTSLGSTTHYLWFLAADVLGSLAMYQYVDDSTELTLVGAGPAWGIAPLSSPASHPGRFWTSGDNRVEIVSWDGFNGGEDINFRVRGAGTGLTVRFYFNADEQADATQVTLTGTLSVTGGASSASRSGNDIINLDADDGSRLYTITRNAVTDLASTGDKETWFATAE